MDTGALISRQNADGGWPYVRGKSWTEPTIYAVMALLAAGEDRPAELGLRWIAGMQRPDGGWPPQTAVDQSIWVTALAAILPPERLGVRTHARAIRWLVGTIGEESSVLYRMREWLLGLSVPPEQKLAGWPWVPGSAGWVHRRRLFISTKRLLLRNNIVSIPVRPHRGQSFVEIIYKCISVP